MWIVRLALRRTYTFVVVALLILILGSVAIFRMSTDIFPEINIPVVSVIWSYTGIAPDEMAARITTVSERAFTTTVNDIEHMESQSMQGVAVIKIFFHPNAKESMKRFLRFRQPAKRFCEYSRPARLRRRLCAITRPACPILQIGMGGKDFPSSNYTITASIHPNAAGRSTRRHRFIAIGRQTAPDHGGSRSAATVWERSFPD